MRWTQTVPEVFTVDESGTLYALSGTTLKRFAPDGQPQGAIDLPVTSVTAIGVFGDDLIVKRADASELFQVRDLATGRQKRAVYSDHERVTAELPGLVWTAGQPVPLKVQSNNSASQWRVWATALGDSDWRELKRSGAQLDVPADFAGLYQLRIAPTLNPQAESEYTLRARWSRSCAGQPGHRQRVDAAQPHLVGPRRSHPGERGGPADESAAADFAFIAVLSPCAERRGPPQSTEIFRFAQNDIAWTNAVGTVTIPAEFTVQLAPGRYELRAECPVSPPRRSRSASGPAWPRARRSASRSTATIAGSIPRPMPGIRRRRRRHAAPRETLDVNQFVNRIFAGGYPLDFANNADGSGLLRDLQKRLAADPAGTAAAKADFGFAHEHVLGEFGARPP